MVDSTSFPAHNLNYHKKNENCDARLASAHRCTHPFFLLCLKCCSLGPPIAKDMSR